MTEYSYNNGIHTVKYGTGIYFIGDPCYVLKKELWAKAAEDVGDFAAYDEFAIAPTMYGDGVYRDEYSGKEFGVDSASLGVVNLRYYEPNENVSLKLEELGAIVEVNDYIKFEYNENDYSFRFEIDGAFILIKTNDEE